MPSKIESIDEKKKNLHEKWDAYFQSLHEQLEKELADPSKDPYESRAAHEIMIVANHILGSQFQQAKTQEVDWLQNHGTKEVSKAMRPSWKQISMLAAATLFNGASALAGFAVPAIGLTGGTAAMANLAKDLSGVAGNCGNQGVEMVRSLDSSKQTTKQHTVETGKLTRDDLKDGKRKQEDMEARRLEDERRAEQIRSEAVASIIR
ncbi:MAG: hypothetical protein ACSNEK_01570 [Parachlamydiaceae bacterium]